eukprot:UN00531
MSLVATFFYDFDYSNYYSDFWNFQLQPGIDYSMRSLVMIICGFSGI